MQATFRRGVNLALVLAIAASAGCTRQGPAPSSSPARTPPAASPRPAAAALTPAAYLATAASIDLLVIRASELALQRPLPANERRIATTLLQDHRGTSAQLSFAGRRLNLLPSATLLPRHQAMLNSLSHSRDFAAAYRRQQIAIQRDALRLHSSFAATGSSPTLRPVAAAAAANARRHLGLLGPR